MDKRNTTIDMIRVFASFGVVIIHFTPNDFIGLILHTLGRFAVPYFFIVAGYFYKGNDGNMSECKRKIKHLFIIILAACAIYIPYNAIVDFLALRSNLSVVGIFKLVVLNSPQFTNSHIWFLPALIYSYILFEILQRKLNKSILLILAVALLGTHLFMSGVLPVFFNIHIINDHSALYRNAYLFGLPFFIIGNYINSKVNDILKLNNTYLISIGILGAVLSIAESMLNNQRLYNGTIIFTICVFLLAVKNPMHERNKSLLYIVGRDYTLDIYIVHVLIGNLLCIVMNSKNLVVGYIKIVVIYAISMLFGAIRVEIKKRICGGN